MAHEYDKLIQELRYQADGVIGTHTKTIADRYVKAADAIEALTAQVESLRSPTVTRLHRALNGLDRDSAHERATFFFEAFADGVMLGDGNREGLIVAFAEQLDEAERRGRDTALTPAHATGRREALEEAAAFIASLGPNKPGPTCIYIGDTAKAIRSLNSDPVREGG